MAVTKSRPSLLWELSHLLGLGRSFQFIKHIHVCYVIGALEKLCEAGRITHCACHLHISVPIVPL